MRQIICIHRYIASFSVVYYSRSFIEGIENRILVDVAHAVWCDQLWIILHLVAVALEILALSVVIDVLEHVSLRIFIEQFVLEEIRLLGTIR